MLIFLWAVTVIFVSFDPDNRVPRLLRFFLLNLHDVIGYLTR